MGKIAMMSFRNKMICRRVKISNNKVSKSKVRKVKVRKSKNRMQQNKVVLQANR